MFFSGFHSSRARECNCCLNCAVVCAYPRTGTSCFSNAHSELSLSHTCLAHILLIRIIHFLFCFVTGSSPGRRAPRIVVVCAPTNRRTRTAASALARRGDKARTPTDRQHERTGLAAGVTAGTRTALAGVAAFAIQGGVGTTRNCRRRRRRCHRCDGRHTTRRT